MQRHVKDASKGEIEVEDGEVVGVRGLLPFAYLSRDAGPGLHPWRFLGCIHSYQTRTGKGNGV
jgi:hypothetical protein